MLSDFYISNEKFAEELKQCNRELNIWEDLNFFQSTQMFSLGEDIVSLSDNYVRAHINATMWMVDEFNEMSRIASRERPDHQHLMDYLSGTSSSTLPTETKHAIEAYLTSSQQDVERMMKRNKSQAGIQSQQSVAQLKVAYKTYFLFIRAFHDACYKVLLNLNGQDAGGYSSMNKCVTNENSQLYAGITSISGYVEWFKDFKKKRDRIKIGVGFSLCGPENDVGINFNSVTAQRGIEVNVSEDGNKCRIRDIIMAINYSTTLLQVIKNKIPNNSNPASLTVQSQP
jgi:hypothetical protein